MERRDGKAFASLFTEDAVYHDVFYGDFVGRERIAEMIDDWFHRTAHEFRWDMHRPVSDGKMLYAYYTFSYVSSCPAPRAARRLRGLLDDAAARRADPRLSRGGQCRPAFVELGFAPERTSKILAKEGAHLRAQPEWKRHI